MNEILFLYEYLGNEPKNIVAIDGKSRIDRKDATIAEPALFNDRKFLVYVDDPYLSILYIDKYICFMRQFFIGIEFILRHGHWIDIPVQMKMCPYFQKLDYGCESTPLIHKRSEIITSENELLLNIVFPDSDFPKEYPGQEEYIIPLDYLKELISLNSDKYNDLMYT